MQLFDKAFDFFQTIEFCHYLGGQIAVAVSKEKAEKMFELLYGEQKYCGSEIFTGFMNSDENPMFLNVIDKQPLAWKRWITNEPNNYGGKEHCATLKLLSSSVEEKKWGLNDENCIRKYCPFCELQEFRQFHLRGGCPEQGLETVFYIGPKQNQIHKNEFLGYKNTRISWDSGNTIWKVQRQNTIIATTNDTHEYPFGTHLWYFKDGNCFDHNAPWRRMNLHRAALSVQVSFRSSSSTPTPITALMTA